VETPPRSPATEHLITSLNGLDIAFDVDLGEIMAGHHVIARGVEREKSIETLSQRWIEESRQRAMVASDSKKGGLPGFVYYDSTPPGPQDREIVDVEDQLHFDHVPGLTRDSPTPDWNIPQRMTWARFTTTTKRAYDGHSGGLSTHGVRDLGGRIPREATRLTITIEPAYEWVPPEPWRRKLVIDLRRRLVLD